MSPGRPLCVHLIPATDAAGAENQLRYLLEELRGAGEFDLELVYFRTGRAHADFERIGVPLRIAPQRARLAVDLPRRARVLRRLYEGRTPDVLHSWLLEGNIVALAAARAWPETRVVVSQRGGRNELDFRLHLAVQRLLLPRADHAISNSDDGRAILERLGMPRDRVTIVRNGVPGGAIESVRSPALVREDLGIGPHEKLLVWVGRADNPAAVAQKDLPTLLSAFALVRQRVGSARLVMVGASGADLRKAELAVPTGVEPVGWLDRPMDVLAAADVVVISSREEGDSNVAGEAMMLGRPVVTTRVGEHPRSVVESGGRAVAPGDPRSLADATVELLASPPVSARIREVARRCLSTERLARETAAVYDQLLSRVG